MGTIMWLVAVAPGTSTQCRSVVKKHCGKLAESTRFRSMVHTELNPVAVDEVPADGRLLKATELYLDQSLMTGESEPVRKTARPADDNADGSEQPGCLYRGTQVVDGAGSMCVTEVGDSTYLGQIARRLSAEDDEPEPNDLGAAAAPAGAAPTSA